eukprot:1169483-Rhodomonas_salina.6
MGWWRRGSERGLIERSSPRIAIPLLDRRAIHLARQRDQPVALRPRSLLHHNVDWHLELSQPSSVSFCLEQR